MINLLRTVWKYADEERWKLFVFYSASILANLTICCQPLVLDRLIRSLQNEAELPTTLSWCAGLAGLTALYWLIHGPSRILERHLAFGIHKRFVLDLYRKVVELPLQWHQDHHSADTTNRIAKAGRGLFDFAEAQFLNVEISIRFLASIVFLFSYCWWIGLTSFVLNLLLFWALISINRYVVSFLSRRIEKEIWMGAALYDFVGNILSILTLRLQTRTYNEIEHRADAMYGLYRTEAIYNEAKWFVMFIGIAIIQLSMVSLYIASMKWQGIPLQIGNAVAIFQYHLLIQNAFNSGTMQMNNVMRYNAHVESAAPVFKAHESYGNATQKTFLTNWGRIHIADLHFRHEHSKNAALHSLTNISFLMEKGQKIALVGSSGSGKTTLLTLLRGLYDANHVDLSIDGCHHQNLLPLSAFSTLIPQDAEIFENTILYNITLGVNLPEHEVQKALFLTDMESVIEKLPNGIYTDIRERGVNLSGGQRQRLALARGIVAAKDSTLWLLDEPTSHLDLATEQRIFSRLFDSQENTTIVVSLHRLHLLPYFDHIIYMEDGQIIEQGPLKELIDKSCAFERFWNTHAANKRHV